MNAAAPRRPLPGRTTLIIELTAAGTLALAMTVIWAVTSRGYFWPMWVYLAIAIVLSVHLGVVWAWAQPEGRHRRECEGDETEAGQHGHPPPTGVAHGAPLQGLVNGDDPPIFGTYSRPVALVAERESRCGAGDCVWRGVAGRLVGAVSAL